jgi:hypothetical protein
MNGEKKSLRSTERRLPPPLDNGISCGATPTSKEVEVQETLTGISGETTNILLEVAERLTRFGNHLTGDIPYAENEEFWNLESSVRFNRRLASQISDILGVIIDRTRI